MVGEEDAALPNAGAAVNDTTCTGEEESKGNEGEARLQLQQQQQSQSNTLIVDHTPAEEEEAEASSSRRQRGVKMNDKNKKNDDDDSSLAPQVATEDRTLLYETGGGGKQNDNDDDDDDVYDDENEEAYMPIVDHTPKSSGKQQKHKSDSNNNYSNSALNRRDSMVVQVGTTSAANDDDDFDDDDDDFSKDDDGTASISNAVANNNNKSTTSPPSRNNNTDIIPNNAAVVAVMVEPCVVLVDHTPQDTDSAARRGGRGPPRRRQQQRDLSMAVLPSIGNTTIDEMMDTNSINNNNTDDDDGYCIMMDQTLDFGPVVDHTPSLLYSNQKQEQQSASKKSNIQGDDSMAVCAPDFSQQQQDEAMYGDDDDDDSSSTSSGVGDGNSTIDTQEQPNGHGKDDASSELRQSSSLIIPQPLLLAKPLVIHDVKQEHVVDHTPMEMNPHAKSKSKHAAAAATATADLSVVVLATVDDLTRDTGVSDIDEDNEDIYKDENELDYAPIVDHTPPSVVVHAAAAGLTTTPATSSALSFSSSCRFSVNNSMAVQVSALDQDYEQHDAMEETMDFLADGTTTVDGSVLHDWERDNDNNNETANKAGLKEKEVTNLVDHTPLEMASPTPVKNTDPSIAVLASIEDDDENVGETEEEDGVSGAVFGLVVDHLPTTPASASVRGTQCSDSVIVQVAGADQETVDEITRDDDGSTTTTDGDTIDDGVGAASSVFRSPEGKLVDHVPSVRRDSRLTGDASTLVAADASENLDDMAPDESYFDLFGPVVDVIPSPILPVSRSQRHAHAPAAEVVVVTTTTAASDANVVVDHVPQMRERLTDDSLATMGLSKLSEEETDDDEEEDDDRQFGPIVDQLPTPRPSRAASRGGCSTVDDLATISEAACPGDNEWEDDDLDMSLQSERIYSSQQPQTPAAGASRDSGVLRRVMSGSSSSADKGVSSVVRFETSGFHDAANNSGGGWYDENGPTESVLPTASFEDAETPPTTPHQRTRLAGKRTVQRVPINEELLQPFDLHPDHSNAATTTRCAKLLNVTKKNGSMFGTLITPEGTSLEVDFGNLLLQGDDNVPTISKEEATPYSQGRLTTTTELEEELFQLRQTNACFREKIESLQTETAKLRQDNSRLTSDLMSARRKEEVNELLDESSKPASVAQQGAVVVLEASDVEQEAKKLAQDDKEAELSLLSALRQDNSRLTANLASAQRRIEELEESKTAWGKQQAAVEAEIVKLKQLAHNEFRR